MMSPVTTKQRLRELATLRPEGHKVLSLYLNLDPSEFPTPKDRRTELESLLDVVERGLRDDGLDHGQRQELKQDVERIRSWFDGQFDASGTRGVAVFAASAVDLFDVHRLARPIRSEVTIDDSPFIEPLAGMPGQDGYGVLLINRKLARILAGGSDGMREVVSFVDDVHKWHEQGGWSQARFQRSVEQEKLNHLGEALDTLFRRFKRRPFDHLVVGAPDELVGEVEQKLHPYLRDRLAGRLHLDVENSTPEQVKAAAAEVVDAHVAGVEREALDRLKQGIGRGDRGVSGPAAVIEALEQARVDTLLLAEDFDAPELDEAVEKAITQSARIIVVRHHDDLVPHAGIGAVLRF